MHGSVRRAASKGRGSGHLFIQEDRFQKQLTFRWKDSSEAWGRISGIIKNPQTEQRAKSSVQSWVCGLFIYYIWS